jgi:hypothetical protein
MGTIFFYLLGAIVRLFALLFETPGMALGFLLSLPGLELVWGYFIWICSLFGAAGLVLLAVVRGSMQIALVYLPLYVVRKFRLRAPRADVSAAH